MNKIIILLIGLVLIVAGCISQQKSDLKDQCTKISDKNQRDSCYSEMIISQTILFKECIKEGNAQSNCRNENIKSDLLSTCDKITDQNTKDLCYNTLVFVYNDANICGNVINQNTRNKCFLFKVNQLYDCKVYYRLPCRLEEMSMNISYCDNFDDTSLKIFCEAIIDEKNECYNIDRKYNTEFKFKIGSNESLQTESLQEKCLRLFNRPTTFEYEKNGGIHTNNLYPEFEPSMEWIKNNLPADAVVSAWWDYGHMIRGIGNAEVIVYEPSEETLDTVITLIKYYFPPEDMPTLLENITQEDAIIDSSRRELNNNKDIENVALILTTTKPEEAINLMKQYNSEYVLLTISEYAKATTIHEISGVTAEDLYLDRFVLNKNSMLYRMLKLQEIDGFERVYSDTSVVIYKIKS